MRHPSRILFACQIIFVISMPGFSQENPKKNIAPRLEQQSKTDETNDKSKTEGLRKIKTRSQMRDLDIDIHIDQKAIEASIESPIENAMRSVDVALERLEINIEPIEIDLSRMDMEAHPIEINIPDLNIEIEPIEVDLDLNIDIDNDIDQDHFERDDDDRDSRSNDKWTEKSDDGKDTSDKAEKEKSKGLKRIR